MCLKCNSLENDPSMLTECDSCHRNIHKKVCSGLNASEIKVIELKGKRSLKFYCEDCSEGLLCVPKLIKAIDELKMEVEKLKMEPTQVTSNSPTAQTSAAPNISPSEELITELQERQKRCNNIMVFNFPESDNDQVSLQKLITELTGNQSELVETIRIGRQNKNGTRALKASLSSSDAVRRVLVNKSKLKGRRIFISADLTPSQRSAEREVREVIARRRSAGEEDLFLKYVQGTPLIVSKKKN